MDSLEKVNGTDEPTHKRGFNCFEILPEDCWREIVKRVGDVKVLLICRSVSPEFKILTEEQLAYKTIWRFVYHRYLVLIGRAPFPPENEAIHRHQDYNMYVKNNRGTHITKLEDVEKLIASKDIVTVGTPFPNGLVVFYPYNLADELPFYKSLESFVNTFPEDITSLVYQFHYSLDPAQFLMQLSFIFKLKNLKRLLIYYGHEPRPPKKFELGLMNKVFQSFGLKIPDMNRLQRVQIREFPVNNDSFPLITILKNFLPGWKALTHFSFNWNSNIDMGEITEQMLEHPPPQKLICLELQDPSVQLVEYFCRDSVIYKEDIPYINRTPRLKDLTVRFNKDGTKFTTQLQGYSKEESKVIQLFNTLDANQADLESLILELYLPPEFQPQRKPLPLNFKVKFSKLKTFRFNYIMLLRWKSLLEVLKEKLPNVETITVEANYDCMQILDGSRAKIVGLYHLACSLWDVFPTLKLIEVLYYEWKLKRDSKIPENVRKAAEQL